MPSRAGRPLATCRRSCDGVFQGTSLTDDVGRWLRGRSLSCPPGTRCRFFPGMNRENEVGPRQPRQARLWLHGDGPREPPRKRHSSWRQDTHSAAVKALGPPPPVTNRREALTLLPDVSVKAKPRGLFRGRNAASPAEAAHGRVGTRCRRTEARRGLLPGQPPPPASSSRPRSPPASVWSAAAPYSTRRPCPPPASEHDRVTGGEGGQGGERAVPAAQPLWFQRQHEPPSSLLADPWLPTTYQALGTHHL